MAVETSQRANVVVIGGGQAGLAAGYFLRRAGIEHVILDANSHPGDPWRHRWDSLELFSAARYSALPGLPFPGDPERSRARTRSPTTWRATRAS